MKKRGVLGHLAVGFSCLSEEFGIAMITDDFPSYFHRSLSARLPGSRLPLGSLGMISIICHPYPRSLEGPASEMANQIL